MKILVCGFFTFLFGTLAVFNSACYSEGSGGDVSISVGVHDLRWHYDHDHNRSWRKKHPWVRWEYDNNHDAGWRNEHSWVRWDYDNNHDAHWRNRHPWKRWDYDNNHDSSWRHDHPWHD